MRCRIVKILHFDRRNNRLTWPERQTHVGNRVETDFHWDTLNHFHVVPGGIFWRQETEGSTATGLDAIDMTLEGSAAKCIHFDFHRLARPHQPDLVLLKIRYDPNVCGNKG